ncbi:hypothetical protein NSK_003972 [Nannochloropsis salina CCMP1776]|uniref:ubiquitinyl hydrolase 1 n=2 Tax=Nannochloropsis salina CCMP1776 TaxID=1027361 RepID=A0A4D9D1U5_9STRA|nr:hypothetical protein NSK_003972 [Nannochloropsis salina CCMP1776]|eukprot:TFJ84944.1 hypothetical protein NSK_003972 [Nannochloropsis salina CCMP1776]
MQQREEASSLPPAEDVHENCLSQSQAAGHNQVEEDRDLLTIAQQEEIDSQIAASQPLVGPLEPPSMLLQAYKDNPEKGFVEGVEDLARRYAKMRRIRRDGNCFYRAFLFAYLAGLVEGGIGDVRKGEEKEGGGGKGRKRGRKKEWERFSQTVKDSKAWLLTVGYEEVAIDIFWEVFVEELEALPQKSLSDLESTFNEPHGVASYMVWYCRLLTSGYLKKHKEEYEAFLDASYRDMDDFCVREVEPTGKECEQVQIMALVRALGVSVRIEYLDGRALPPGGQLPCHVLPDERDGGKEEVVPVTLLYRPGHYDLLVK